MNDSLTITAAGGKEACDLVSKGSIVGMLHDGHQLNSVVTQLLDPWKDIGCELCEQAYTALWRSNSDYGMGWIKSEGVGLVHHGSMDRANVGPFFFFFMLHIQSPSLPSPFIPNI